MKRLVIRSLIEVIRLVPEDGAFKVELRGELGGYWLCVMQTQKAGPFWIRLCGSTIEVGCGHLKPRHLREGVCSNRLR
jgi:hypothetical protein